MAELSMNEVASVANEGAVADTVAPSSRDSRGWARIMSLPVLAGVVAACSGGGSSDAPVDSLPAKPSTSVVETTDAPTSSIGDPVVVETTVVPATTETTVADTTTTVDLFEEPYFGYVCDVPGFTDQPAATNLPDSALPIAVLAIGQESADPLAQIYAFYALAAGADLEVTNCKDEVGADMKVLTIRYPQDATGRPNRSDSNREAYLELVGTEVGGATWDGLFAVVDDFGDNLLVPKGEISATKPEFRSFSEFGEILAMMQSGTLAEPTESIDRYVGLIEQASLIEQANAADGTNNPVPVFAILPFAWSSASDRAVQTSIVGATGGETVGNGPVSVLAIVEVGGVAYGNALFGSSGSYFSFDS